MRAFRNGTAMRFMAAALAALAVAGCGDRITRVPASSSEASRPGASIILLDPLGRLLAPELDAHVFVVHGAVVRELSRMRYDVELELQLEAPSEGGAQLLALAPGCAPLVLAVGPETRFVQLEEGFPVRFVAEGAPPELPDPYYMAIELRHSVRQLAGMTLPRPVRVQVASSRTYVDDHARAPEFIRMPAEGVIDLLVPVAGTYEFSWELKGPGSVVMQNEGRGPLQLAPGQVTISVPWPREPDFGSHAPPKGGR